MLSALRGRATDVVSVTVPPSGAIRQTAGQASGTPLRVMVANSQVR